VAFLASALVLLFAGSRFVRVVDEVADRSGAGEALTGAVLLGATTSLPGLIVTVIAALRGEASLAVGNAIGGIAAQTVFLALADMTRRANLEHSAASLPNLLQTTTLIFMIALVIVGVATPGWTVLSLHPVSILLPVAYVLGLVLTRQIRESPMWHPYRTAETRPDEPRPPSARTALRLAGETAVLAAVVATCGFVVAQAGLSLKEQTELGGTVVGGLFTSVVTSLPELVTVLAAVRAGALTLAIADIIGGNCFDVLFVAAADVAFAGPLYAAVGASTLYLLGLTLLLTAILSAGLIYRDPRGIGFEGVGILVVYAVGFAALIAGF